MVTAVIISVLILLHVYLEQLSFQERQLNSVFAHRIQNYIEPTRKCYEELALTQQRQADGLKAPAQQSCNEALVPKRILDKLKSMPPEKLRQAYSELEYTMRMTDNTIKDGKLQIRQVPVLGIEVPANDFVIVMSLMSLVFVVGVWINLRGIKAALSALANRKDGEIMRLAKLNTVFLTALEADRGHNLAKATRSFVLWLPFGAIVAATVLGYWDPIAKLLRGPNEWHFGPMDFVLLHLGIALVVILLHFWVAIECKFVLRDTDELFSRDPAKP